MYLAPLPVRNESSLQSPTSCISRHTIDPLSAGGIFLTDYMRGGRW